MALTGAPRAAEGRARPRRHTSVWRRAFQAGGQARRRRTRRGRPCSADRPASLTTRVGFAGGEWRAVAELAARCLTPAAGGRGRYTPLHPRPQRRGPRHDQAEGVIPSRRGWRPRPRRQRGQMPRAILVPVSGDAGPAASRGRGRRRGPRGHGPRSSSTPGRHLRRPRDATAPSERRRQLHRGRSAPTPAPAPHGPCVDPRVRARRQASGSGRDTRPRTLGSHPVTHAVGQSHPAQERDMCGQAIRSRVSMGLQHERENNDDREEALKRVHKDPHPRALVTPGGIGPRVRLEDPPGLSPDHPPEQGMPCSSPTARSTSTQPPRCGNPRQTRPQELLTISTTPVELVDPPINDISRVSLAAMARWSVPDRHLCHGRHRVRKSRSWVSVADSFEHDVSTGYTLELALSAILESHRAGTDTFGQGF